MSKRQQHQADNARFLQQIKGTKAAARYLRFCGFGPDEAVRILARAS